MKRQFLSFLLVFLCLGMQAQEYSVSTEVQHKNALLEEFTGIRCGYCSDAHRKAARFKRAAGNRVSVVAIHCGGLSVGISPETDYRVAAGETIGDFLGGSYGSFPAGSVNRRDWSRSNEWSYSRGAWQGFVDQVMQETAPVNLWGKAVYDAETRQMKIRIEGYFTGKDIDADLALTVLLVQNNVLGTQYDGFWDRNYRHQHMLRDAVTDAKGERIEDCRPETYFVREYTYEVPAKYGEVAVNPAELELVAFMTRANGLDVLNAITVKPNYVGETLPLRAEIADGKIGVTDGYSYRFLEMMLTNKSNSVLTTAEFDVTLNGETVRRTWTGEIPALASQDIRIPIDWIGKLLASNSYQIVLKSLNGQEVEEQKLEGRFGNLLPVPETIRVKFVTNDNVEENTYGLYDADGNCVKAFGPYDNGQTYEETLELQPNQIYCLEVTDFWGNGVYPYYNAIEVYDAEGNLLKQQDIIPEFGYRLFLLTPVMDGISGVTVKEEVVELYTLSGYKVATGTTASELRLEDLPRGVYLLRTSGGTQKVLVK